MRAPQAGRQFNRLRGRHDAPVIIVIREELQQSRGGRPEGDTRIRGGRHCGDDQRAVTGKATERISFAEWHAMVFAKLGLLLELIQIMYQNRKDSPFQTRPATMAISVAAVCISGFATAALLKSKAVKVEEEEEEERQTYTGHFLYCHRILDMLVLISGVVTLFCLVSVFIPNGLGWIVFVSCASTISALVVGWHFLFLPIFGRIKSGHGELRPSMV